MRWWIAPSFVLLLLACDGSRDIHAPSRIIHVTEKNLFDLEIPRGSHLFEEPDNFSGLSTAAFFPDGNGGFEIAPGVGFVGGLIIPNAPDGECYLSLTGSTHFTLSIVTSASDLDLSEIIAGRPGLNIPESSTPFELHLSNLAPWQEGDELEIFSTNTGVLLHSAERFARSGAPSPGAQALRGFSIDFAAFEVPLVESSLGDFLNVLQLSEKGAAAGLPYRVATRSYEAIDVSMVNGMTTTSSGAFSEIPLSKNLTVTWNGAAYEAVRGAVSPKAIEVGSTLEVRLLLGAAVYGPYETRSPDLVVQSFEETPTDVTQVIAYGNPLPVDFTEVVTLTHQLGVPVQADSSTVAVLLGVGMTSDLLAGELDGQLRFEPRLTPVLDPKVNGADAFTEQRGVGLTPMISWTPPALGTPNGYEVAVFRVTVLEGATVLEPAAHVITQKTEAQVPPGPLVSGEAYFARITAFDTATRDVQRAPFRVALPSHRASAITGLFRP